jgi:Transglutaminase-like superfamily
LRTRLILFRSAWWLTNLFLILALAGTVASGVWEFSTRQYLKGFSDAIVSEAASPQHKAEAILAWMRNGPPRLEAQDVAELSTRNPQDTLNYRQLLQVCGTATNAFLNLGRSAGLNTRRLLLLTPDRKVKHVVAELEIDGRWVIVDPAYRSFLKDTNGTLLTRKDLQNPELFREATGQLSGYLPSNTYERFAHVRLSALPFESSKLRQALDAVFPNWDEFLDWSLLLERKSFLYLFVSATLLVAMLFLRVFLGWMADHELAIPRFRLRANLGRATAAFLSTPETK